ncbi:hypothetical protein J1605_006936 [Eschrichtius robustus]|uniref:Spermatogenesis-associated protein 33 n=1 Tax=Eschrichtius robustus TaxID=9764 RepID=A0AB34H4H7_ESCRO|nr:hypothetical protein J1605_006936 [Eschrichtius robustus]
MAGPAAAALSEADGLDLPAASTEQTGAGWRAGGRVPPGRRRFRRLGALARGRAGLAGGGVAVATARAREAAARPLVSQWAGLPPRCRARGCVAGKSPMGLSKSKQKLRKGGEPKSGRTYSIPKATERPVDRPSQESEKPPDTKPAESFHEKKGAAKRQWPSSEVEGLTLSCNQWSGGSDLWAGQPGRAHRDAGCAGSHRAGRCPAAGEATGELQPAALISQPVQPRCRACDELVVTPAPGLQSPQPSHCPARSSPVSGHPHIVCFTEEFFHRLTKYLDVFFLLEKPDVNSEKKKFAIPQIVVTTASKETLISYGSTGMEEQRTIRERAEPGPFYRHRNPSTVDAYNSQTKE